MILHTRKSLHPALGYPCAVALEKQPAGRSQYTVDPKQDKVLKLREPALVTFEVTAGGENSCKQDSVWKGPLPIAQLGSSYALPIPAPTVVRCLAELAKCE